MHLLIKMRVTPYIVLYFSVQSYTIYSIIFFSQYRVTPYIVLYFSVPSSFVKLSLKLNVLNIVDKSYYILLHK